MKVLIVNHSDRNGGAARAAYRLHESLLLEGVESKMLVLSKSTLDNTVISLDSKIAKLKALISPFLDRLKIRKYKNKNNNLFSSNRYGIKELIDRINLEEPDIVHLHWINHSMINIKDLHKINAPIVWSMHDNWLFTGGCHIKWNCSNFKTQCNTCPSLGSTKYKDISYRNWNRKNKIFKKISFVAIGLSKWLTNLAHSSSLLQAIKTVNLPNNIDTKKFRPLNKEFCRELLNLPKDKKLILFGAMSATSDINKGYKYLIEALNKLENSNYEYVVFGANKPLNEAEVIERAHYLGQINDDELLVAVYSACDVTIVPSMQENLSNTIMESMSCDCPVVAFDIGGNSDLISHLQTGYLAKAYEPEDLALGVNWILNNKDLQKKVRGNIQSRFDYSVIAPKYIELYKSVLEGNHCE